MSTGGPRRGGAWAEVVTAADASKPVRATLPNRRQLSLIRCAMAADDTSADPRFPAGAPVAVILAGSEERDSGVLVEPSGDGLATARSIGPAGLVRCRRARSALAACGAARPRDADRRTSFDG